MRRELKEEHLFAPFAHGTWLGAALEDSWACPSVIPPLAGGTIGSSQGWSNPPLTDYWVTYLMVLMESPTIAMQITQSYTFLSSPTTSTAFDTTAFVNTDAALWTILHSGILLMLVTLNHSYS